VEEGVVLDGQFFVGVPDEEEGRDGGGGGFVMEVDDRVLALEVVPA
jgi:hypothetical protein